MRLRSSKRAPAPAASAAPKRTGSALEPVRARRPVEEDPSLEGWVPDWGPGSAAGGLDGAGAATASGILTDSPLAASRAFSWWSPMGVSEGMVTSAVKVPSAATFAVPRSTGSECKVSRMVASGVKFFPVTVTFSPGVTERRSKLMDAGAFTVCALTVTEVTFVFLPKPYNA